MKAKITLFLILFLGIILRIYKIDKNPPALYWDEVAMGYNVRSLLETGADEYGHKWPFFFESFQDYKLPGYIYSIAGIAKFFGVNTFTIRFPALIYGIVSIIFLYLLSRRLFGVKTGLISSFLLSISPWHIQFTRAGFEASGAFAFIIISLYLLYRGIQGKIYLYLGYIFLILGLCFYNGVRIVIPGILFFFLYLYWREIKLKKKDILIFTVITLFVAMPIILQFLKKEAFVRYSYINIFLLNQKQVETISSNFDSSRALLSKLFDNRYLYYSNIFSQNYLSYFSPYFIVSGADGNLRHSIPNINFAYLWSLPFLLIGVFDLIKNKHKSLKLLLPILFLSPIAASLAAPSPHALRSFTILIPVIIFISVGIISFSKKIIWKLGFTIFIVLILLGYTFNLQYKYPIRADKEWAYGYKEVFAEIKQIKDKYKHIYITGNYWRPYIFALYYLDYPPKSYQKNPSHSNISNLYFGYASYDMSDPYYDYSSSKNMLDNLHLEKNNLLVLSPQEVENSSKIVKVINDLSGKPLFIFVES